MYMSYHIKPTSVASYLSGIQSELEAFFPNIRAVCKCPLVTRSLRGCKRMRNSETKRRLPLEPGDIRHAVAMLAPSEDYDDILFLTQLVVGFCALHRLGELVWPDTRELQSYANLPMRHRVEWLQGAFSYFLPIHKGDRTYEGNRVVVQNLPGVVNPDAIFRRYIHKRDLLYPGVPFLWVRQDCSIPQRSWFLRRFRSLFPDNNLGGHSIRAGGAVALALAGVPPDRIQDIGRWTSDAFQLYIRKNPVLLQSFIWRRPLLGSTFT